MPSLGSSAEAASLGQAEPGQGPCPSSWAQKTRCCSRPRATSQEAPVPSRRHIPGGPSHSMIPGRVPLAAGGVPAPAMLHQGNSLPPPPHTGPRPGCDANCSGSKSLALGSCPQSLPHGSCKDHSPQPIPPARSQPPPAWSQASCHCHRVSGWLFSAWGQGLLPSRLP